MVKNIKDIKVGDELVNVTLARGGIAFEKTAVIYVDTNNIAQLPLKNGSLVPVAVATLAKENNEFCRIYAKSKSTCLVCDKTRDIIDYEKSHITIK